jgi:hypothetical protein
MWAWLNGRLIYRRSQLLKPSLYAVNTRCLYHDLKFSDLSDNITMCPLLDFANHTSADSLSITLDEFALGDGELYRAPTR